ncbi:hypothetical protein CABS01_13237 [Colletotrichum abscissum]|uniref:uncharacterized protein n=1 Tax=Colletotrichum abscissum TaxID=1671311 RepID=UPI0027D4A135|nr:uncharacterized protein CABS01_13237 [Colletotrichum abscissum]KAK1486609.1 hypothetical protein CABS01_13237 [Colletotrichum abscissum]
MAYAGLRAKSKTSTAIGVVIGVSHVETGAPPPSGLPILSNGTTCSWASPGLAPLENGRVGITLRPCLPPSGTLPLCPGDPWEDELNCPPPRKMPNDFIRMHDKQSELCSDRPTLASIILFGQQQHPSVPECVARAGLPTARSSSQRLSMLSILSITRHRDADMLHPQPLPLRHRIEVKTARLSNLWIGDEVVAKKQRRINSRHSTEPLWHENVFRASAQLCAVTSTAVRSRQLRYFRPVTDGMIIAEDKLITDKSNDSDKVTGKSCGRSLFRRASTNMFNVAFPLGFSLIVVAAWVAFGL